MSLRRAHVSCTFDVTNDIWTEQVQFVGSALMRVIKDLSNITVGIKALAAKKSDKSGRAHIIKHLVLVPKGANNAETFLNGSKVGRALINPEFDNAINRIIEELHGSVSAVLECEASLSQALKVQAPGLIIAAPEPSPIIELDFLLTQTGVHDIYNVVPKVDFLDTKVGQINFTRTPSISEEDGAFFHESQADLFGPNGLSDPLTGIWKYTSTEVLSDAADANSSTFIIDIDTGTLIVSVKKDGVDVGEGQQFGLIVAPTFIGHGNAIILLSDENFLVFGNSLRDFINGGFSENEYVEETTLFRKFDSINSSIQITNNTGATIPQGTVLGQISVLKDSIAEIF